MSWIVKLAPPIFPMLIPFTLGLAIASLVRAVIKLEYPSLWALYGSKAPLSSQSSNQLP